MSDNIKTRKMGKSYVASTISISLLLLMLGIVGYFMLSADRAAKELSAVIKVSVFVDDSAPEEQLSAIEQALREDKDVADLFFLSSEKATAEFEKSTGIVVNKIVTDNPIPSSFEVTPRTIAAASMIEERAKALAGVSGTFFPTDVSGTFSEKMDSVTKIILGVAAMLLIVALSLIYYTLKLSILVSANSIRTMQLVGARSSFIKRPYIRRAVVQGFIAALVATVMMIATIELSVSAGLIPDMGRDWAQMAMLASALCVIGVTICTLFTTIVLGIIVKNKRQ